MANVINLSITPLYPIQTDAYTLSSPASTPGRPPLAQPPKKRLRSCLSPARSRPTTPFEELLDLCSGYTSRSASYGSERSKSVRWEGEGEVPVTSYFDTYSRDEYDRTPLAAPSAEERACVLPPRDSRCMTRSYQCFLSGGKDNMDDYVSSPSPIHESPLSSPALAALDAALTSIVEVPGESLDSDDDDFDAEYAQEAEEEDDEEEEDDRQWEECMDRRRMMFARMCGPEITNRHPQFDGYRSLSSTLANILKSVGCDDEAPPIPGPIAGEDTMSPQNLGLGQYPPDTPSLTSGSSDDYEVETLVNSLTPIMDSIAIPNTNISNTVNPVIKDNVITHRT